MLNKQELADQFIQEGLKALPDSLLFNFYTAEVYECRQSFTEAKERFETIVMSCQKELDELKPKLDNLLQRASHERQKLTPTQLLNEDNEGGRSSTSDERADVLMSTEEDISESVENSPVSHQHEVLKKRYQDLCARLNNTWIQYMKFSRRSEVLPT